MRTLLLLLLFSLSSFASTSQTINTFQFGGAVNPSFLSATIPFTNIGNILQFTASYSGGSGGNFLGFYKWGANAGTQYQVTSGKTLYIIGVSNWCSSASSSLSVGYADAALSSNGTTSTPTNAIYFGGGSSSAPGFFSGATQSWAYFPFTAQIPASKYPFIINYSATNCVNNILGIEK